MQKYKHWHKKTYATGKIMEYLRFEKTAVMSFNVTFRFEQSIPWALQRHLKTQSCWHALQEFWSLPPPPPPPPPIVGPVCAGIGDVCAGIDPVWVVAEPRVVVPPPPPIVGPVCAGIGDVCAGIDPVWVVAEPRVVVAKPKVAKTLIVHIKKKS